MSTITRPDVERELAKLKAFQRDTVEHVFARMYHPTAPARRFLVADEVGLGKTLVARGLVAKVIDRLWDDVKRIDVIYICSNGSIARQNISRLNVSEAKDATLPSRITLLPTVVRGLKGRKLNFISLTPQTSFDLRSSLGTYEERALLYWLLPEEWTKGSETAVRNVLQGGADRDAFRRRVGEFDRETIDADLQRAFREHLDLHQEIRDQFIQSAARFQIWRERLPDEDRKAQRDLVGRLRSALATSCLKALEPDLIILDEFQRFKHLLDGTDRAGDLARDLFSFGNARVLLLSATPYKMYTLADETKTDDHFRDFIQTVKFFHDDPARTVEFQGRLHRYSSSVFALGSGAPDVLLEAKHDVQESLREVMVRTERLAASADRNGMLVEMSPASPLSHDEVSTFLAYSQVAEALDHSDVTEYWKSAPYLLNFMDDYQFKEDFTEGIDNSKVAPHLHKALAEQAAAILPWEDVERYRALDPANSRLRHMISDVIGGGAWRWLWLPAALPYYAQSGAYDGASGMATTKRLIFSSWQVVPKVVAAVLSYEAERLMFGDRFDVEKPNTPEQRERLTQLLRFARRDGGLTGMALLTLHYPSITLAELGDPLAIAREAPGAPLPTPDDLLKEVRRRIDMALAPVLLETAHSGPADQAWYWAAPLLLDLARHPGEARRWLDQANLADAWRSDADEAIPEDDSGATDAWTDHVAQFRRMANGQVPLGAPPLDLVEVLAKVALGGPAVVGLRALSRICGGSGVLGDAPIRNNAGWIATGFRTLFNLPEVTAMVRGSAISDTEERYWEAVLDYCIAGGIQAVMDEYAHVVQEWQGVAFRPIRQAAKTVATTIAQSMQLRTAQVGVDVISVDGQELKITDHRMRARFATRFGARQIDEGAGAMRADDVRMAFNSPFWPFVLCSTSVGQEGLDFHLYCHAVVHWNLPSNPVDLEQREGRVHRYKGHAIRKNAALLYGADGLFSDAVDPWQRLFESAHLHAPAEASDLVPYWILPADGGARIERHLPMHPLSRDVDRADALRRALTVYRMAFGQNRQDDLVAYLTSRFRPEEIQDLTEKLRIELAPASTSSGGRPRTEWHREIEAADHVDDAPPLGRGIVTLAAAASLLQEFVAVRAAVSRAGVAQYQELLDLFASTRK